MDRVSEVCDDWAGQEALLLSSLRSKYMGKIELLERYAFLCPLLKKLHFLKHPNRSPFLQNQMTGAEWPQKKPTTLE